MPAVIIVAPVNSRLTTLATVKDRLGGLVAGMSDPKIERMIDEASAEAVRVCNRLFGRATYRQRVEDHGDAPGILLDASPVTGIVSATLDGVALTTLDYEQEGAFLYRLQNGVRGVWYGYRLVVEFQAGWALPSDTDYATPPAGTQKLPFDIEKAVIDLVGVAASEAGRDATIKSETVEGVGTTSYYVRGANAELSHPGAEAALMGYRRFAFV